MNADQIAGTVLIVAVLLWLVVALISHLSQESAATDWERHVNSIPLSPEMEARLAETFPPSDTPIFDAVKRQQDVRFMAEAIAELRELGVDLTEGSAS